MKLTQLLDRPIAYHRCFVTLTGSVKAAILLSQAMYWQQRAKQADGWWYKTAEDWQEETGLTRHEQETARKDCEPFLMSDLRGVPATLYWKVNEDAIMQNLFDGNSETSFTKTVKLDSLKQSNINKNAETTTETTSGEDKKIIQQANAKVDAILENEKQSKSKSWTKIPEPFQPLCRAFCEATTLEYSKRASMDWLSTFSDWMEAGYTPDMIHAAVKAICTQQNSTPITRPGSIEWKLIDMKVKKAQAAMGNVPTETKRPQQERAYSLPSGV